MLTFTKDDDYDDRWIANLGAMIPWPKLRDVIDWLNESEFRGGWMVTTSSVSQLSPEARAFGYTVQVAVESSEERDAFIDRWGDWF